MFFFFLKKKKKFFNINNIKFLRVNYSSSVIETEDTNNFIKDTNNLLLKFFLIKLKKFGVKKCMHRFFRYNIFKIRLDPIKFQNHLVYKIVVVNNKNRILQHIGYYNPYNLTNNLSFESNILRGLSGSLVILDKKYSIYWLGKCKVVPNVFIQQLFSLAGLLKLNFFPGLHFSTFSKNNSNNNNCLNKIYKWNKYLLVVKNLEKEKK